MSSVRIPRFDTRERVVDADWLHLSEDEEVRWAGRPSLFTIAPQLLGAFVLVLIGIVLMATIDSVLTAVLSRPIPGWVSFLPLVLVIAGLASATITLLYWWRILYVITSEEIYVKEGFISRNIDQIRLERVQNTTYNQSVVQRILSFGDITVFTAGTDTMNVELHAIPNPRGVNAILTELLGKVDGPYRGP